MDPPHDLSAPDDPASQAITTESLAPSESQSLPCPIDGLPIEHLATIFVIAANSSEHLKSRLNFPVQIQSVCHLWRIVSLSTPALWAILDLRKSGGLCNSYLRRSGTVPLEVYVYPTKPSAHQPDLLRRVSPRINILWLIVEDYARAHLALSILHEPLLNVVEFNFMRPSIPFRLTGNSFPFQDFPRIRSLNLQNFTLSLSDLAVSGLHELRVTGHHLNTVTKDQLLTVFRASPGLRVLELNNFEPEDPPLDTAHVTTPLVALENLRHLILRGIFRSGLESLVSWISATQLRRLEIWKMGPEKPLFEVVQQWRKDRTYVSSPDLDIGSHFPDLETLKMDESPETVPLTIAFRPTVKHLVLIAGGDRHLMCKMFEDLLVRWGKGEATPLESLTTKGVSINHIQNIPGWSVPKLRQLVIDYRDVFHVDPFGTQDGYKRNIEERLGLKIEVEWGNMRAHRNPESTWSDTWRRH